MPIPQSEWVCVMATVPTEIYIVACACSYKIYTLMIWSIETVIKYAF